MAHMESSKGIITVVDRIEEQEDEALRALRGVPKFEPLVASEPSSHFSLASVFGSLSVTGHSRQSQETGELAFHPEVLVDALVQMSSHNKKYALDIQEYQKSLGNKIKSLDNLTATAFQDLSSIHHQAKTSSDQLLSVVAIEKQAKLTATLLHGIVGKLHLIVESLEAKGMPREGPAPESYPNLCRFIRDTTQPHGASQGGGLETGIDSRAGTGSSKPISSLALLGQSNNSIVTGRSSSSPYSARTSILALPKARASMALTSNAVPPFEPMNSGANPTAATIAAAAPSMSSTGHELGRVGEVDVGSIEQPQVLGLTQRSAAASSQHRASDNLRKFANKASSSSHHPVSRGFRPVDHP